MHHNRNLLIPLALTTLLCCDFGPEGWTAGDTSSAGSSSSLSTSAFPDSATDSGEASGTLTDSDSTSSSSTSPSTSNPNPTDGGVTTDGATLTTDTESSDTESSDTEGPETGNSDTEDDSETDETGDSETEGTTGSSMYCDGDPLQLDYMCDANSDETLFVEVPGGTIAPNTTTDFELPISECGDGTLAAAGFVARIRLQDACLWSMRMSLVCPAGSELELTRPDVCAPDCEPVPGVFDAIFRTSSSANCLSCDFMEGYCYRQASGETEKNICTFLDECLENSSEPWKLRVEAGDTEVQVDSVALTMALRSM